MDFLRVALAAAIAVVLGACAALDTIGPRPPGEYEIVRDQVRVTLAVTPEVIASPGTVVAVLTYENVGIETVRIGSGSGCLSFSHVYRGEERIPFPATQYACTAAATYRDLEPGAPLTVQWPLVIGSEGGVHVPAGTYRFVAALNTHAEDLERTFVVR